MLVKCPICNRTLLEILSGDFEIVVSSEYIKRFEKDDDIINIEIPDILLEIKCFKCKSFITIGGKYG